MNSINTLFARSKPNLVSLYLISRLMQPGLGAVVPTGLLLRPGSDAGQDFDRVTELQHCSDRVGCGSFNGLLPDPGRMRRFNRPIALTGSNAIVPTGLL